MVAKKNCVTAAEVCQMYESGLTIEAIAKRLSVSTWLVCERMKKGGVSAKSNLSRKGISQEDENSIAEMYSRGDQVKEICKQFNGIDKSTVWRIVEERGIPRRTTGAAATYSVNSDIWLTQTPSRDYWLGFLMADGSVNDRGKKGLQFRLVVSVKDIDHVILFKKFITADCPVYDRVNKTRNGDCHVAGIDIHDQAFCKNLASIGCISKKTWVAKAIPEVIDSVDFWRGYVDGDGCLMIANNGISVRPIVSSVGHVGSELPHQLSEFFSRRGVKSKLNPTNNGNGTRCDIDGGMAAMAARILYRGSPPELRLERKYQKYLEIETLVSNKATTCKSPQVVVHYGRLWTHEELEIANESMKHRKRKHREEVFSALIPLCVEPERSRLMLLAEAEGVIL